ncbi:MAG: decaprenyl-phosphate phosphoribosyltransferase [Kiritimatiellae bacterium]|jgi:4-hydroxybenzoate polyprenyltransferase|nr:decaprenyl-phosphate phosphoribosyltransferase [Kiritimatiellia bacterium]
MKIVKNIILSMRPWQWTKNGIVFAAMIFALGDSNQNIALATALPLAIQAALVFCLLSSGVYIINDVVDWQSDREHPVKRKRPIASGELPLPVAVITAVVLVASSLIWAHSLQGLFFYVAASYLFIQFVYTIWLKKVALVDIMIIALGFVIRAIAGATVIGAKLSPWLLLCTFLLALFLALCKRRAEKSELEEASSVTRSSMKKYDIKLLDQLVAIVSSATIICYSIYTLSETTYEKFGTYALGFTIPFVMFGIFRYLDITYRKNEAQRPDKVLLTDMPMLLNIGFYGLTVIIIFYFFVGTNIV